MRAFDKYFKNENSFEIVRDVLVKYIHSPAGSGKLLFTSNHDENTYWGTEYEKYGECALALAAFSFTFPGTPLVYSGQELPNLKRLSFFEKDNIDWTGEYALHDFYSKLLRLKKSNPALHDGASILLIKAEEGQLVYLCRKNDHRLLVILNLTITQSDIFIEHPALTAEYFDLFTGISWKIDRKQTFRVNGGGFLLLDSTFREDIPSSNNHA